jgi:hypothetical protein
LAYGTVPGTTIQLGRCIEGASCHETAPSMSSVQYAMMNSADLFLLRTNKLAMFLARSVPASLILEARVVAPKSYDSMSTDV